MPVKCCASAKPRREVLALADAGDLGVGHRAGCEHAVGVALARRHEAVRGEQHRRRQVVELLLLVLPGRAEVALQVRVLLQLGVRVRRKHLAVGVHVDALALGLLEKLLQVVQVVARDDDERAGLDLERDLGRLGRAVRLGVRLVEHAHAGQVDLADLQHERHERVDRTRLGKCGERFHEEGVDCIVGAAEHASMVSVGGHAADAEQHERLARADVLVGTPDVGHVVVGFCDAVAGSGHGCGLGVDPLGERADVGLVEVDVGHAREQAVFD